MKKFYSNGKLLITGEYLVLDGALSLAVPCKFGQSLSYEEHTESTINWKSFNSKGEVWFETTFSSENLEILECSDSNTVNWIRKILKTCYQITKKKIKGTISCHLEFPNNWGLGSSSTLLNNIAQLYQINPYEIHFSTTNGSGYDIACTLHHSPITYQLVNDKPVSKPVNWSPNFKKEILFIFLNKKQKSYSEINRFNELKKNSKLIEDISNITCNILDSSSLDDFENQIGIHESIISSQLGITPVKQKYFSDFEGSIKSLGAWGGDFIMATRNNKNYFIEKGFKTIFEFEEMVKTSNLKIAS